MIYLDNAATTQCDPRVARLIHDTLLTGWGNPSSLHRAGFEAEQLVARARRQMADAVRCAPEEILFTSGATEANNLALLGGARAKRRRGERIVSCAAEHASVLGALEALGGEGFTIDLLAPDAQGALTPEQVEAAVDARTVLFSCMLVNNETGAVQDIAALAAAARRRSPGILVHCDAVQALGKEDIRLQKLDVDLMTFSAHKVYGPKGIGALYVRKGARILPLLHGGGQERGLRPGTENTAYIAGMGLAASLAAGEREERRRHALALRARLDAHLQEIAEARINSPASATPFICNVSFEGVRSETLLHFLESRGIYVSSGSACAKGKGSHVLAAMGLCARRIDSALRLSLGGGVTLEEIDTAAACLREGLSTLARAR